MIHFTEDIVIILNDYFSNSSQFVESISLTSCGFNIRFLDFDIQCNEEVFGNLNGKNYHWLDSPNDGPWGMFCRQYPKKAYLVNPALLCIQFDSGDSISISTELCIYESVIFTFPPENDCFVMEVF